MKKLLPIILGLIFIIGLPQGTTLAANFYVNDPASLIAAINTANANGVPDTIILTDNITLTQLNNTTPFGFNGLPVITSPIRIQGNGFTLERDMTLPLIPETNRFRLFELTSNGSLTLINITLRGGNAGNNVTGRNGGAILSDGNLTIIDSTLADNIGENGGAIYDYFADLTIINTTFTNNTGMNGSAIFASNQHSSKFIINSMFTNNITSFGRGTIYFSQTNAIINNTMITNNTVNMQGGGIVSANSNLTINNSIITDNTAGDDGGGIFAENVGGSIPPPSNPIRINNSLIANNTAGDDGGGIGLGLVTAIVTNSTIMDNTANETGGGIYNFQSMVTVNASTLNGNDAPFGGGFASLGTSVINNSTISGNRGNNGGGIINLDTLNINNSTVYGNNVLFEGGGISDSGGVSFTLNNTIVAGNTSGGALFPNCLGVFAGANNLSDGGGCTGFGAITPVVDFDVNLVDNGGPTQTHALIDYPANPAIDPNLGGTDLDQRGVPIQGGSRDIGAYESGVVIPILPTVEFADTGATYSEDAGTVLITLTVSGASDFAGVAEVYVIDLGTGSAQSGADYADFGVITVYIDCTGGCPATVTVPLTINTDPETEPDETVDLQIVATNGFAVIGAQDTFTATIENSIYIPPPTNINVFDPAISKIGFLVPGQVGVTGEQIEWVVTVSNTGNGVGQNVTITDDIDPRLQINSVDAQGGQVNINGQTVDVTYPTINAGESVQFSIFTTVLDGETVNNTACVAGTDVCATGTTVGELPATGESPWWRMWVVILMGISGVIIFGVVNRHNLRKSY